MAMTKTALVTGSEGFIGSFMVKFLQAEGWNVVGGYRTAGSNSFPKLPKVRFEHCDLRNGQRVEQIFEQYEPTHVFHFGAQSLPTVSWADPEGTFESNIMGSLHLFEAIRHRKRPPVVVSACSSAEYGHVPPSAIPVKRGATAPSAPSVRHQQGVFGPAGAGIFPGLPGAGGKYSPFQYDRAGQNR